jgi:hypothetical protein
MAGEPVTVLGALVGANVQFVVVGEPGGGTALQLVVSRHPTNLEALGKALDRLGSTLRTDTDASAGADAGADTGGPDRRLHRVGDPSGTVAVRTPVGDVDLIFGGLRRSLYAETLEQAVEREIEGTLVKWSEAPAPSVASPRVTSRMLGRRLMSLAEGLAHLMDRRDEPSGQEASRGD